MTVHRFETNTTGKDYIIGDLHGCVDMLNTALEMLEFDPNTDRVFSTGDLIDRGPNSPGCLDLLDNDWFYAVKGNHEQFMEYSYDASVRHQWVKNGGGWMVGWAGTDRMMQYRDMVDGLPIAIVVGEGANRFNIIHAQPPIDSYGRTSDLHIDGIKGAKLDDDMLWARTIYYYPTHVQFDEDMSPTYVGHSPVSTLVRAGPVYFLDRGAHGATKTPKCSLALACPVDGVIYEYSPLNNTLTSTPYSSVPDTLFVDVDTYDI